MKASIIATALILGFAAATTQSVQAGPAQTSAASSDLLVQVSAASGQSKRFTGHSGQSSSGLGLNLSSLKLPNLFNGTTQVKQSGVNGFSGQSRRFTGHNQTTTDSSLLGLLPTNKRVANSGPKPSGVNGFSGQSRRFTGNSQTTSGSIFNLSDLFKGTPRVTESGANRFSGQTRRFTR